MPAGRHSRSILARALPRGFVAAAAAAAAGFAGAADVAVSAFGTLGYAQSDKGYDYLRVIDDDGSFDHDSLLGGQVDVSFAPRFGATVQAVASQSLDKDNHYSGRVTWAFLSWRPTNNWLLRLGKLRVPLYLHSENLQVGATFPLARLPTEMYATALTPTTDFTGASASLTQPLGGGELSVDGYWGKAKAPFRVYLRDDIPGAQRHGAEFVDAKLEAFGLALTWRVNEHAFRLGLHHATAREDGTPLIDSFPFVPLGPGLGYFQTSPLLPGPGVQTADKVRNTILTLGADVQLPAQFRLMAELARRDVRGSDVAPEGTGYYVALLRPFGAWTPYAVYGKLRSTARLRDLYDRVNGNVLPPVLPGAAPINAAQRAGADGIAAYDQSSVALGTSWAVTRGSLLKAEWQRVRTGSVSQLVDAPPGEDSGGRRIHIWSLSYSFVF